MFSSHVRLGILCPSPGLPVVSCRWVFAVKVLCRWHDGHIYKTRLVVRDFTQIDGVDYLEIFIYVARLNSICVLFSLPINHQWPIFQLDACIVTLSKRSI